MSINKGATGSPSLSKTKGSLAGATRKSAGLGLVLCHCAGNTRPHDRSAGWACVVAFRHPQVFSFPSAGIVGSPALGCCARLSIRFVVFRRRPQPSAMGCVVVSPVGWHYRSVHS